MSNTNTINRYVIAGANGYLGEAMANQLSQADCNRVFSTSRGPREYQRTATHQHLPGIDLLRSEDISRLATAIDQWADGPFHVVNCVGYFPGYRSICDTSVDEARKIFESNVLVLYATAHRLLPVMRSKGGGHFIAFSTHAVSESYPLMGAFTAAKAAVGNLIQTIANEYSKDGIIANALAIATLDCPKERQIRPEADYSNWLQVTQIVDFVKGIVQSPFSIINGNTIHLFNYSESFFHKSYFDRLGI